jgi:hypothetical protein
MGENIFKLVYKTFGAHYMDSLAIYLTEESKLISKYT